MPRCVLILLSLATLLGTSLPTSAQTEADTAPIEPPTKATEAADADPRDGAIVDAPASPELDESAADSIEEEPTTEQPPAAPRVEVSPMPPGQADLDKAIELKLTASGIRDLNKVIELLDSAVDAGLAEGDKQFADSMLVGALLQRATALSGAVLKRPQANPKSDLRWLQVRQFALSDLQRVLEIQPNLPAANLLIGRLQLTQYGDPNAARRALGKVIDAEPDAVKPTERAQAHALRGAALREPERRLADFSKAIELDPEKTEYLIVRARELQQRKKYDEAMADLDQALEMADDNPAVHELRALVLLAQDKPAEAIQSFDRATELKPNSLAPYQFRGEAYSRLGDKKKAIEQLDKAIEIDPNNLGSRLVRATLYQLDGQHEKALSDVEAVLARQPGLLRAHLLRVQVLEDLGRSEDAIEALQRIAQAAPDKPDVLLQLSAIYQQMGEFDQAIDTLSSVIEQAEDKFLPLRLRGDTYLTVGEHTSALADFARAYELKPDDSGLLNNYAWTLATSPFDDLRDGPRAVELATRAAELTEFDKPHILSTLAAAYAEMGDFDRAIEYAEKAVTLDQQKGSGPEVEPDIDEQLAAELASYRSGKPWRELKDDGEDAPPPVEDPAITPATEEDPLDRALDF